MTAMRMVWLLRHAEPQSAADGQHLCLGSRSDPPLSDSGRAEAATLEAFFAEKHLSAVGTSPLLRSRETAALVFPGREAVILPGLTELDCGEWDGLDFDCIRQKYPAHYARRGLDPTLPPPGGERLKDAAARGLAALRGFLNVTEGDIAVVSHAGVLRAMLCVLSDTPLAEYRALPMPYLNVTLLRCEGAALRIVPRQKGNMNV